ncbi:SDR family NAD(P)-dependent oxidoreductase [Rhodococcus sp. NPDC019627]|uniref:SDR family NAD(P)-dependent oxidoreductase n=1 Tax=unclassified Rhodococcus (in: high G+C Gram-positive bacteria) TaxID=192944 RepID=UPI0033C0EEAC
MTPYSLSDKVVFITGAGRGLGAATATALAERGARVVLADIDLPAAQRAAATLPSGRSLALHCDVTQLDSVQEAARRAHEEFGRIDVVIANAGILGHGGTFRTLAHGQVGNVMSVNVDGVVNTVSATLESVIESRGQIVLVSSVFAYVNGAGAIPYAMSKAAVEQLGRGLHVELARHGASTMTAYFSLIETDMIRHGVDADPHVSALLSAMPKFIIERIEPQTAATAIADGLQRRQRVLTVPGRWRPIASLRGILGPIIDAKLARDVNVQRALAQLENPNVINGLTQSTPSLPSVL